MALSWAAVLARRLARHYLVHPAPRTRLVGVVSEVCGIHAQVMSSAEMSLGLRVDGLTARDLAEALWTRRELLKIYGLRGTVHIVAAEEYGWWSAALQAMDRERGALDPKRLAYLGITEREFRDLSDAVVDAIAGTQLTREELGDAVGKRVGRRFVDRTVGAFGGAWPVWTAALGHAALRGELIFGPPRGTRVTFVHPRDWLGRVATVDPDRALGELFVRFLSAYGPASERDFAQWTASDPAVARNARGAAGPRVEEVAVEGATQLRVVGERAPRTSATTLLLPRFDVYAVGSYPRDVVAPPDLVAKVSATGLLRRRSGTGRAFLFGPMPVLVLDGVISGIWESKRTAKRMSIRVQPFVRLERERRDALEAAAQTLAGITGTTAELAIGAVTTRPHL